MKLVFSTKNVTHPSFLSLCKYAYEYGYSGFEIYDAIKEREEHYDSILRSGNASDAKRKLFNRGLSVSALRYPYPIDSEKASGTELEKYVDMASIAGIESVILRLDTEIPHKLLSDKLGATIKKAGKSDVQILFETAGYLANTQNVLDVINYLSSRIVGASWNVRETFFSAGESTETTIKTLGAYIKYVRLGDMKDGKRVLLGEGDLPVEKCINALASLNFEGYIAVAWNEDVSDADIVLTHFLDYMSFTLSHKHSPL